MLLDPANGLAKGEGGCLLLQHGDPVLLKNTIEKHSYIPVKMRGSTIQL
jgi:hypothetical protein